MSIHASVVIQAGGKSSRMGRDKSFLTIRGKPLIQLIIEKVSLLGDDLIITSNEPEKFVGFKARIVPDEYTGVGALAGFNSGLRAAENETVFMVANDMPFINIDLFKYMETHFLPEIDLAIPYSPKGYEPFHAIYRKSTCFPAVEKAIRNHEKRIISWFESVKILKIEADALNGLDPQGMAFLNLNTPEDLEYIIRYQNDVQDHHFGL